MLLADLIRRASFAPCVASIGTGFYIFKVSKTQQFPRLRAMLEPTTGLEPVTSSLPRKCSTTELCGQERFGAILPGPLFSKPLSAGAKHGANLCIVERVMGIEPTSSAWKAEVLPLNYTRQTASRAPRGRSWWRGEDSNLRRLSQQIYSLPPLTAREPLRTESGIFSRADIFMSTFRSSARPRLEGRDQPHTGVRTPGAVP
jgi:hypothetical protein